VTAKVSTASASINSGGFASGGKRGMLMTLKSPTTTKRTRIPKKIAPVHPGEILREDILTPLGMSVNKLALSLGVPAQRMGEVVNGKRAISPDTALRLARFLGTTPEFWIRLQARYEFEVAKDKLSAEIEHTVRPYEATA
jgi:addiction module HigA family antidote